MIRFITTFVFLFFIDIHCFAQLDPCSNPLTFNCASSIDSTSKFIRSTPESVDFTFDKMSKYVGGITYTGATVLRLKIDSVNSSCKWKLVMYIDDNQPASDTSWVTTTPYGGSGNIPTLELIEVRVYNGCGTPYKNGVFRTFSESMGDAYDPLNINNAKRFQVLDIIPDNIPLNKPGNCNGSQVNGAGSYLTNYNEYNFNIDYRIKPKYSFRPGLYSIVIRFCLVEVP